MTARRRHFRLRPGTSIALVSLVLARGASGAPGAIGQERAAPPAPVRSGAAAQPPAALSRADVAQPFLAFERAYASALARGALTPAERADLSRRFDAATFRLFGNDLSGVVRSMHELLDRLDGPPPRDERFLRLLRAAIDPPVLVDGDGDADGDARPRRIAPPSVRLSTMYAIPDDLAGAWTVSLAVHDADGRASTGSAIEIDARPGEQLDFKAPLPDLPLAAGHGTMRVVLESADGAAVEVGRFAWLPEAPSRTRVRLETRLDEHLARLGRKPPGLEQAIASFRARAGLLADEPSSTVSAQFLVDQHELVGRLESELEAIEAGRDPYAAPGDWWRVVRAGPVDAPVRVVVPDGEGPFPVVVALHGVGGDENLFMEGYGAGSLKRLALDREFVAVSPSTIVFTTSPLFLDALLDMLAAAHPIDRDRVVVLGHSMGAGATARLVAMRPKAIAAYACIAGFGDVPTAPGAPPGRVILGGDDAIVPARRVRPAVEAAIAAGAPVELVELPDAGHTLLVPEVLPATIDWLLDPARAAERAPEREPEREPQRKPVTPGA